MFGSHVAWLLVGLVVVLAGCAGRLPVGIADGSGRFAPCPSSPNCVSSDAPIDDRVHSIEALRLRSELADDEAAADEDANAWQALIDYLESLPRVEIATRDEGYVHAVFTTRLMRYRDDVELALDPEGGVIRVRSASRVGHGDMGVNRARIESIRDALVRGGYVEPLAAEDVSSRE